MAFWSFQCFLLALRLSDEQCDHTAWLQVHASEPEESAELPKALQELADCDKEDLGCVARKTACSLATKLSHDWPQSYSGISEILGQLQDVCNGKPLALTSDTSGEALEVEDDDADEEMNISHASLLSQLPNICESRPGECTTNVVQYEKKNPGAKYGMNTGKAVAKASVDTLKEILKDAKLIALEGLTAFAFIGFFISAFFPSAGRLPVNPCTFATQDWGRCVWEQVKPFPFGEYYSDWCYYKHSNETQKQTVSFWLKWLAPIPIWLNNVVLMQQIEVHKEGLVPDIEFECSAI